MGEIKASGLQYVNRCHAAIGDRCCARNEKRGRPHGSGDGLAADNETLIVPA